MENSRPYLRDCPDLGADSRPKAPGRKLPSLKLAVSPTSQTKRNPKVLKGLSNLGARPGS